MFGERGDQAAFVAFGALTDFFDEVVDLVLEGTDFDGGIDDAGGADDLFDGSSAVFDFVGAGRGGEEDDLVGDADEFVEVHGAVVEGGGETEAMVDEGEFAGAVAVIHAAYLGKGDVGFVDDGDELIGEVIE